MAKEHYEYHELECALTDAEVAEYQAQLPVVVGEYEEIEKEKKKVVQDYNTQLGALRGPLSAVGKKIRTRTEKRCVRCYLKFDVVNGTADVIREDTHVVVKTRIVTSEEKEAVRQSRMAYIETTAQLLLEVPAVDIEN